MRTITAAALLSLLAAAGCAAPRDMIRRLDEEHAAICRGLADVVDVADRAFGEPRIEDREQIVQAKIGPSVTVRENEGTKLVVPVSLRVPLPALERRANIFLRLDTVADSLKSVSDAASSLDSNKSLSATVISRVADVADLGVRLDLDWDDGPTTGVRPFVRWERREDPLRFYVEQQVSWDTDLGLGEKTILNVDRILDELSFARLFASMETNAEKPGRTYEHALIWRRTVPREDLVLSAELGVRYNTFNGDSWTATPGAEEDPDEGYLQLRVTGKVFRPWIEYEVMPGVYLPWRHADAWEWGITFALRVVYESFLHGPAEAP
jgi:hypothetical protein